MIFANGNIYCIANATKDQFDPKEMIVAINVTDNGNISWTTYTYQTERLDRSSLFGLTYIKSQNLIASSDQTLGIITLLDANTGTYASNLTFPGFPNSNCSNYTSFLPTSCIGSYILGVNNGIVAWYTNLDSVNPDYSTLISFNLDDPEKDVNNIFNDPNAKTQISSVMTICDNVLISMDYNLDQSFEQIHAYQIDENLNIIEPLWSRQILIPQEHTIPVHTGAVCIVFPDIDNSSQSQIIFNAYNTGTGSVIFYLMQVETGQILNANITFPYTPNSLYSWTTPAIYTGHRSDMPLLIFSDDELYTVCYNVNINGFESWEKLWTNGNQINMVKDNLIVNETLFQATLTGIQSFDLLTGQTLNHVYFGTDPGDNISGVILMAGRGHENNIWIIAVTQGWSSKTYNYDYMVYAFK
eukprot:221990_1